MYLQTGLGRNLVHITDWMPTLLRLAGLPSATSQLGLDGVDQWDALLDSPPARREMVYNLKVGGNNS